MQNWTKASNDRASRVQKEHSRWSNQQARPCHQSQASPFHCKSLWYRIAHRVPDWRITFSQYPPRKSSPKYWSSQSEYAAPEDHKEWDDSFEIHFLSPLCFPPEHQKKLWSFSSSPGASAHDICRCHHVASVLPGQSTKVSIAKTQMSPAGLLGLINPKQTWPTANMETADLHPKNCFPRTSYFYFSNLDFSYIWKFITHM